MYVILYLKIYLLIINAKKSTPIYMYNNIIHSKFYGRILTSPKIS